MLSLWLQVQYMLSLWLQFLWMHSLWLQFMNTYCIVYGYILFLFQVLWMYIFGCRSYGYILFCFRSYGWIVYGCRPALYMHIYGYIWMYISWLHSILFLDTYFIVAFNAYCMVACRYRCILYGCSRRSILMHGLWFRS